MKNVDDLIRAVTEAYWEQPRETVDNVFLSLQQSLVDILETNGNNTKSVRRMKKQRLRREGRLPVTLGVTRALIENGRKFLELGFVDTAAAAQDHGGQNNNSQQDEEPPAVITQGEDDIV